VGEGDHVQRINLAKVFELAMPDLDGFR